MSILGAPSHRSLASLVIGPRWLAEMSVIERDFTLNLPAPGRCT
jgi:hypothetical protein